VIEHFIEKERDAAGKVIEGGEREQPHCRSAEKERRGERGGGAGSRKCMSGEGERNGDSRKK
jgi:hypothetical protein